MIDRYEIAEMVQRAVRDAERERPKELPSRVVDEVPVEVELADRADLIVEREVVHHYMMRIGYLGVGVAALGAGMAVVGAVLYSLLGALLYLGVFFVLVGGGGAWAWFFENSPLESFKKIVSARADYSHTQRRL